MKILMATWDCGGNVPPFLGIGAELVGRGHQVQCLGSESLRAWFAKAGVEFLSVSPEAVYDPLVRVSNEQAVQTMSGIFFADDYANDLRSACEQHKPDVLVIDYCLATPLSLAEILGVPTVVLIHTLPGRVLPLWDQRFLDRVNEVRTRLGLATVSSTAQLWSKSSAVLVASFRKLDGEFDASDDVNLEYVGPIFDPVTSSPADFGELLNKDKPLVLVSFSTVFMHQQETLRQVILALSKLDVRGIVTTGRGIDPDSLPNVENVTKLRFMEHAPIMPYLDLAIVHGGHGSITKALSFGVPILSIPHARDQMYVSDRMVELGAGIRIDRDSDADTIAQAVEVLLRQPSYRDNARKVAIELDALGSGARNGSDLIESVAIMADA